MFRFHTGVNTETFKVCAPYINHKLYENSIPVLQVMHATPECPMKSEVKCYEVKIKSGSCRESNPGQHLTCAARAVPLSCDNQTTTSSHNPLYVLSGCQVCD